MADIGYKTAQLFDWATVTTGYRILWQTGELYADTSAIMSDFIPVQQTSYTNDTQVVIIGYDDNKNYIGTYQQNGGFAKQTGYKVASFTISESNCKFVKLLSYDTYQITPLSSTTMLNEGSIAKPYEPYGWVHSLRKLTTATEAVENPLYSDGTAITAYTLKGNTVQSGTPTPSNPITISGVGNKTANLLNIADCNFTINSTLSVTFAKGTISFNGSSGYISSSNTAWKTNFAFYLDAGTYSMNIPSQLGAGYARYIKQYSDDSTLLGASATSFTLAERTQVYFAFYIDGKTLDDTMNFMLAESSTVQDFEPYGYKIPISSGGVTTPIYLGEAETTRNIYKLVLTGQESFWGADGTLGTLSRYWILPAGADAVMRGSREDLYCTHYTADAEHAPNTIYVYSGTTGVFIYFYVPTADYPTLADYKAYIQQQYANGTPVTLYYILATPQTATVNEPLMKIGTYADTLSNATSIPTTEGANTINVDTTVQPSEFTATWTGWHNAYVKEKSENLFDKSLNEVYPNSTLGNENQWSYGSGSTGTVVRMACKPNTTYTLSISNSVSTTVFRISIIDSDETPISGQTGGLHCTTLVSDGSLRQATITTTSGTKYILFQPQTAAAQDAVDSLMLNEGQTALPYEPYWK